MSQLCATRLSDKNKHPWANRRDNFYPRVIFSA